MAPLPVKAADAVLDMICHAAVQQDVHFLWRPQLRDPKDEMVLEAAVNGRADYLVTHNLADFAGCRFHGLHIMKKTGSDPDSFHVEHADHIDVWRVLHGTREAPAWMRESGDPPY